MATKKVEEKKDKKVKKDNNKKMEKKVEKKTKVNKKDNVKETVVEDVKKVCPSCGKKFLSTLDECPKCGYSDAKNTMYDDEENVDEFEEYDDEEDDVVEVKKTKDEKKEEPTKVESKKEKDKNKKVKYVDSRSSFNSQGNDILDLIKILIAVVILVVVVYFVIALVNGDFKDNEDDTNAIDELPASIQNEKILVSSVFDKADEEYYVLVYDASDEGSELYYGSIYDTYKSINDEDVIPMFWVDLSDGFNSEYAVNKDEKSNPNVKDDYKDLKLQSPTLIRVKKGKAVDYYEGDAVAETISEIVASYNEE